MAGIRGGRGTRPMRKAKPLELDPLARLREPINEPTPAQSLVLNALVVGRELAASGDRDVLSPMRGNGRLTASSCQ